MLPAQASFAASITYNVALSGPNESPANASPGLGSGTVIFDDVLHTMAVNISFSGLTGNTTASHIHAATTTAGTGTSGVATTTPSFTGFPLGVTSGVFISTLDLTLSTSYNASCVTANGGTTAGAEAALEAAALAGKAYYNIHTSTFGCGEIRGFLTAATPEPGTVLLSAGALLALGALRRRTKLWPKSSPAAVFVIRGPVEKKAPHLQKGA